MELSYIGAEKLSLFLKDIIIDEVFDKFSPVLNRNVTQEDIENHELNYQPENYIENLVWSSVFENPVARTCIELAFFLNEYIYAKDILKLLGDFQEDGITLRIAAVISGFNICDDSDDILDACHIIKNILAIKKYNDNILDIVFYADFTLIHLITNNVYTPSTELESYIEFVSSADDYIDLWDNKIEEKFSNIVDIRDSIGIVYGEKFSGRKTVVKNFILNNGKNVLILDYKYLKSVHHSDLKIKLSNILRDCYLLDAILCISDISYTENEHSEQLQVIDILNSVMQEYSNFYLPLFITAEPNVSIVSEVHYSCFVFSIPKLSVYQSTMVWNYFLETASVGESCFDEISQSIILPVGKIKNIVYTSISQNIHNDKRQVVEMCYNFMDNINFKGVTKTYPKYSWEDLKLPDNDLHMLHQICTYARYKSKLMEEWGMGKLYQYGSCVSALFTGPPGTGKTMSANVIANDLNLALYKVDLSQIMDKYIGETEKHLGEIFDYAEKSNAVLFFDEADALIGKRSDISDSKDKYANTQVSYILQRIEEYNGIVLMATNYSSNIDSAITRRIRYVINFLLPNKEIRKEIWKSMFTQKIPHKDIDFDLLSSDTFEFSGAMIKNIVLNASIMAISENSPVTMTHISKSIIMEYKKANRTINPLELQQFL